MEMTLVAPSVQNPYQPRSMIKVTLPVLLHHPMSSREACLSLCHSMDNSNPEIMLTTGIIMILRLPSSIQILVPRKVATSSRSEVRTSNPSESLRASLISETPLSVISLLLVPTERQRLPTQPEPHARPQSLTISENQPSRSLLTLLIELMTEPSIITTNLHSFSMPSHPKVQ